MSLIPIRGKVSDTCPRCGRPTGQAAEWQGFKKNELNQKVFKKHQTDL